jgi:hypothetical protein
VLSDPAGITGATAITNIVQISEGDYANLGSTSSTVLYVLTPDP